MMNDKIISSKYIETEVPGVAIKMRSKTIGPRDFYNSFLNACDGILEGIPTETINKKFKDKYIFDEKYTLTKVSKKTLQSFGEECVQKYDFLVQELSRFLIEESSYKKRLECILFLEHYNAYLWEESA